ncbi:unnamed protein product [Larinioides sclopetarius]|uniref:Tudor domain-containing protein n=1 Tax=Larinioides sclopetarius TaxID=280406 RepID=A0AAV2B7L3_9ARAC
MPNFKSKLTREEQLQKEREAERKRYYKIKNDPAAYEEQKEKERQKYLKKKMKGAVKPISKMTARDQRMKRKHWKNNSRTYRIRSKNSKEQQILIDNISSTDIDDNVQSSISVDSSQIASNSTCSSPSTPLSNTSLNKLIAIRKLSGRKKVRRDRSLLFRKCKQMENQVCKNSQTSTPDLKSGPIIVGTWVAVVYDGNWFPGLIEEINDDNFKINFMLRNGSRFYWPNIPDVQEVPKGGILCLIKSPPCPISS